MQVRSYLLVFVFFLCFGSFLAGWLTAVFILPGNFSQINPLPLKAGQSGNNQASANQIQLKDEKQASSHKRNSVSNKSSGQKNRKETFSFFEEMKKNIGLLFDPYKMDSMIKADTFLNEKDSPIRNQNIQIPLKAQPGRKSFSENKNPSKTFQQKEDMPYPPTPESSSLGPESKTQETRSPTLKKVQEEFDKKNHEQFLKISENQKFFAIDGKFSFLVNAFSEQKKALEYVKDIKRKHPNWSFFIKVHEDHTRIYLGPFPTEEKAMEFKQAMPPSLSPDFLEEVSL